MNSELQELYAKYFYYILAADIFIGLLLGAIPLILSIRRNKRNLGIIALVSCGVAGGFTPILGIIVAAAFTWWILRSSTTPVETVTDNDPPNGQ